VTVLDEDSGNNGQVNCTVLTQQPASPPPFQLVPRYPTEYQLVTAAILDRELAERYHVTIRCQDGGGGGALAAGKVSRVSERSLDVLVGDVNDHAPVFMTTPLYSVNRRIRRASLRTTTSEHPYYRSVLLISLPTLLPVIFYFQD